MLTWAKIAPVTLLLSATLLFSRSDALSGEARTPIPSSAPLAVTIRAAHPRLLVLDSDLETVRQQIASDPFEKAQFAWLQARGERLLSTEPDTYALLGVERSLLTTARDMEDRILTLAGLYRLTGDRRFAARATREMLAAASFRDWNPAHFLDTAELTCALGIGYDWLYPILSTNDRATIRAAIIGKGIEPWLSLLRANHANYKNNWAQVTNGGEVLGALAIAEPDNPDDMPQLSAVLDHARTAMGDLMRLFAPDGGFEEGPVYWNYATAYNVLYLAALDSALGGDSGASNAPGFAATGNYRIHSIGPGYLYANFADAQPPAFPAPQMFWLARRFHRPEYAAHERQLEEALRGRMTDSAERESVRFAMLGLFWSALDRDAGEKAPPELPLTASFSRIAQVFLRSSWSDPKAWYLGLKGGDAKASHGHLDLGSFVFDADGERWAIDLGPDSYGLPGYFGPERWNYYRTRTEGHNTLTVDGENDDLDAKASLLRTGGDDRTRFAILDMRQAYKGKFAEWRRGFSITSTPGGQSMLIQDEIRPRRTADVVWHFHTLAAVTVDGRTASLSQNGTSMELRVVSPSGAVSAPSYVRIQPLQASVNGVTDVTIRLKGLSHNVTLAVILTTPEYRSRKKLRPLCLW